MKQPVRITATYLAWGIGAATVLHLLIGLLPDQGVGHLAHRFEGILAVLVSGGFLYWLLRRYGARLDRALEATRERDAFFQNLVEHTMEAILVIRPDGRQEYASPAITHITGLSVDEYMGRELFATVHPDDLPAIRAAWSDAFASPGTAIRAAVRRRHADGSLRYLDGVGRVIPDGPGAGLLVVNLRDATESRHLEAQLRQAQKLEAVGQFTAGIVHDLNNILSVVITNAELLIRVAAVQQPECHEDLVQMRNAALDGADMVRKLLAFSRRADLTLAPTDLRRLTDDVTGILRRLLPPSIAATVEIEEDLPATMTDAGAVQQILLNLATNARDAMPAGGTIRIALATRQLDHPTGNPMTKPGLYVGLSVTDTGTGMDEETAARIFDPFFTTKPVGKGTGLGMSMILGFTQQQGGFLEVDTAPGRGTTIRVFLPVAPGGVPAVPAAPSGPVRGGTESILLVEDQEALRRTGKRILESFGYHVRVAPGAAECLRLVEDGPAPDLIVSDVNMEGTSGPELYAELRVRGANIPFVFASGEDRQTFQQEHDLHQVAFLAKPWTLDEVGQIVRQTLDDHR